MNYDDIFSKNLPAPVAVPAGLRAETKYVFSVTYADPEALPPDEFADAMRTALLREGRDLAMYPPPQGHLGMRELIAHSLSENRGFEPDIDCMFLSAGAGGAIQAVLDAFIDPGDIVLVEEFSYLGTLGMLLGRRAEVIHIPTDDQGMDTDALESTLKHLAAQGKRPKLIYTISVYQNPMGMTLSLERRKRMVELSQQYGVPIFENESYADCRIEGPPLPQAMSAIDDEDSVMYVSAYTKLLGCGLRLGYGVVPPAVRDTLTKIRFGTSPSHLAAMTVFEYLRDHKDDHIERVGLSLRAKRDAMLAALGESFPPECSWNRPDGGMMIWVRLPEGADTWAALDKAVEADVKYNPGPVFRANRDGHNFLRLTYSHNSPEEIHEGISRLAEVFHKEGLFTPSG